MSEQSNNNSGRNQNCNNPGGPNPNPNRRPNNQRRRHHNNRPRDNAREAQAPGQPQQQQQQRQPNPNQNPNQNPNNQQRRRPHQHNRPRRDGPNPNASSNSSGFSIERIYEKYLNLMDQHIIARRKYHDLFYRADPAQKNKLERNFYNTLNDVREFESRLAPDVKVLFEKRNNGYQYDRTYTSNHEIPVEGDEVPKDLPPAEPHLLQSQIAADYSNDTEESVGTAEDYLRYKNF